MADLKLRTVTRTAGNNQALKDGLVTPRSFAFEFEEVPMLPRAFRRMVRELAYDICEMAFTTYLCARAAGKKFTAVPIFPVRAFHHGAILHNTTARLVGPKDLEGRRVGVNRGYTVTTGVWARGILQDEYGVDLSRVTGALRRRTRRRIRASAQRGAGRRGRGRSPDACQRGSACGHRHRGRSP